MENDEVRYLISDGLGDSVEMLAAFSQDDEGPILANELANVRDDQAKPVVVICERAVDLLNRRLGGENARVELGIPADHAPPQSLSFASRGPADDMADGPALHRDDRLVTIAPVWCRRQACDVSGRDSREHTFDLDGWYVMAFVDDDVAVGADEVPQVIASREGLNHRDIDSVRQSAAAGAEPPDRLRCETQEPAQPFAPLLDQGFAVDEDKCGAPAARDQVRCEHGLAPARRRAQDADFMPKERPGSGTLRAVEFAEDLKLELFANNTFVA